MLTRVLADLLRTDRLTAVVDVGANPIDGDPPYKAMLEAGLCTVAGFEPQPDALAELQRRKGPHERYFPYVVGDGEEHELRITRVSGMTSLLEPDQAHLRLFNGFPEFGEVLDRERLPTRRLDDVQEIEHLDLLKIDVQGAELSVFRNADRLLAGAVAVQTEVSFITLYEGQPTFGEVDLELRSRGFVPHAMPEVKRWSIAPVIVNGDFRRPLNQLLEADVVYVRDFARPELMTDDQLRHLALIAHHVYASPDLAHLCLAALVERSAVADDAPQRYLQSLAG